MAFTPHGMCLRWDPVLIWSSVLSNGIIGTAYLLIALGGLVLLIRAARDVPVPGLCLSWLGFIFWCGMTHFMEIVTLWQSYYAWQATVSGITAAMSLAGAFYLLRDGEKVLAYLRRATALRVAQREELDELRAKLVSLEERRSAPRRRPDR